MYHIEIINGMKLNDDNVNGGNGNVVQPATPEDFGDELLSQPINNQTDDDNANGGNDNVVQPATPEDFGDELLSQPINNQTDDDNANGGNDNVVQPATPEDFGDELLSQPTNNQTNDDNANGGNYNVVQPATPEDFGDELLSQPTNNQTNDDSVNGCNDNVVQPATSEDSDFNEGKNGPHSLIYETNADWTYGCSRIGASHIINNMPCQDAYSICSSSNSLPSLAIAVADGHGNKRHDLSQFGASIAVKAAVDQLQLLHTYLDQNDLKSNFDTDFSRKTTRMWREYVLNDAKLRQIIERIDDYKTSKKLFTRYGTTLLASLITSNFIFIGQIGDGEVLIVRPNGEIEQPFQQNDNIALNETNSLSSTMAEKHWQTNVIERGDGGFLLMATDGLTAAYAEETYFFDFVNDLLDKINNYGIQKIIPQIPNLLDSISRNATGDDITLTITYIHPEQNQETNNDSQYIS